MRLKLKRSSGWKKQVVFGSIIFGALALFVYAQTIIILVRVVPPGSCRETDGGYNIGQAGCVSGTFVLTLGNATNVTLSNVTACDFCLNNVTLVEFVCGQNVAPQYSGLAGGIQITCPTGPGLQGICVGGRCV